MQVHVTKNAPMFLLSGLLLACSGGGVGSVTQDVWGNGGCDGKADAGQCFDATVPTVVVSCGDGGEASVTLAGKVVSTSALATTVSFSIDGGLEVQAGTIAANDFVLDHGELIAPYEIHLGLLPGHYDVQICLDQGGGMVQELGDPVRVCVHVLVKVDCGAGEVCGHPALGFFGDLVANKVLCNSGHNNVPIHLKAHAGDNVWLTIDGPGGYQKVVQLRHAGDSCVYQYNWATRGGDNGGPGDYVFTATDRDALVDLASFKASLSCQK